MKSLIGVIGDMHMKDYLSYADHILDRRVGEKKEVLDFIVESFKDCDHIVFLGDNFNSKNNTSETNREFVEFLERFVDKQIYVLSGNHEKKGDGKTAIDFLAEVKKDNWSIFTSPKTQAVDKLKISFLPYMLNSELEVETSEEAVTRIMEMEEFSGGDILFAHHAISGTTFNGIKTEMLKEMVLPKEELEKRYKLIIAGHIHDPQQVGRTIITGSLFTSEVGEIEKFIWKIKEDLTVEQIKVPAREIHKLINPSKETLVGIDAKSIVKVILTDKKINVEHVSEFLKAFDASLLIEDYPDERKRMKIEDGAFDFSIEALLKLYSEAKGIDYQRLLKGLQIINND